MLIIKKACVINAMIYKNARQGRDCLVGVLSLLIDLEISWAGI